MDGKQSLSDLGELSILRDIIYQKHERPDELGHVLGDDCVDIDKELFKDRIVWTTDATPTPISWLVKEIDFYTFGWYSVLINMSDIAAMGAQPFGLLLSVTAPPDLTVHEFNRFLSGVEDCCRAHDSYILGGNIQDGDEFSCDGTAMGSVDSNNILRRRGSREGDYIVAVGELGAFWAAVFKELEDINISGTDNKDLTNYLDKPMARVTEGRVISQNNLATAGMDNSDSIVSCCYELADHNNLDFVLTIDEDQIDPIFKKIFVDTNVNMLTALCSWGDWNLVVTVPPEKYDEMKKKFDNGSPITKIGRVQQPTNSSQGGAYFDHNKELKPLNKHIRSERFQQHSPLHGFEISSEVSYFSNERRE